MNSFSDYSKDDYYEIFNDNRGKFKEVLITFDKNKII